MIRWVPQIKPKNPTINAHRIEIFIVVTQIGSGWARLIESGAFSQKARLGVVGSSQASRFNWTGIDVYAVVFGFKQKINDLEVARSGLKITHRSSRASFSTQN